MTKTNRLGDEISPYLLQHANNPVDWFAWNDEAFCEAKKRDKPIFLSIGYSTCHWCHVMAHECFEDEDVARRMNDAFICVKVDREELPHIDAIYMNACQMMTGTGGWPLTIIMTPEKKPFFAATYLPKHSKQGLMGMMDLIPKIKDVWEAKREEVLNSAESIARAVAEALAQQGGGEVGEYLLHDTFKALAKRFSREHGGFGHAPKFPTPHTIMFLLRYYRRTENSRALIMAEKTLYAMSMGGIFDHIGYGFHRYSTDERWLVPHFEKMLYDQALIAIAYIDAFLATRKLHYKKTAEEILQYVLRDMVSPEGLFFSAEDADSEGREGTFYLWKDQEMRSVLDGDDYRIAHEAFSIEKSGNTPVEGLQGENILHLKEMPQEIADRLGIDEHLLLERLSRIKDILFEQRKLRVRPFRDNKALSGWNGLMIAALARAGQAFGNAEYTRAAARTAAFILENMIGPDHRLFRVFCDGSPLREATADDYAFFIWGIIELYEATFDPVYLDAAVRLSRTCIKHYLDRGHGGFFLTADDTEVIIARTKESYDGALPSSNSVLMLDLLRLAKLSGDTDFEQHALGIAQAFSRSIAHAPDAHTFMMTAFDFLLGPTHEVVISGDISRQDTQGMIRALRSRFLPHAVIMVRPETTDGKMLPGHIMDKETLAGRATAYVCTNRTCTRPTTDVSKLLRELTNKPGG